MSNRRLYYFLFPFFWALAFIAYYRAHGAQFVYDHNMWAEAYERLGWAGIRTQFGEKSLHYIFQYTYFLLYKVFGWNGWYWTTFQTAWHAVNAVLFFAMIRKWCGWYGISRPSQIAFIGALFFLLSPYHTEVVIWGAGLEYMMITSFILVALICLSEYFENGEPRYFVLTYVFYLVGLLTWELALVFPAMAFILFFLSPFDKVGFRRFMFTIFLPMSVLVPAYFLLTKWSSGSALTHYGAAAHMNVSPTLLIPNISRFLLKLFDVSLVYGKAHSYTFIQWLSKPMIVAVQIVIYIGILGFCLRALILRRHLFIVLMAGLGFVSLLPMLNLYFAYFTYIESDRYVYLCSGFFYGGLAMLFFQLHRYLRCLFIAGFLFTQVFFLHRFVTTWRTSGRVVHGLVQGFRWQDAPHIYVLATPDAVSGAWCLRSLPPYGIAIALKAQRGIDISQKMDEVMQYEMNNRYDSCHAEKIGEGLYRYQFTQYGNWFIKSGLGTGGWEDDKYKVEVDQWGMSFTVLIKKYVSGDVVIYQVRDHWEEVK
ncbi:MAG: hypothetical protein JWO03_936 [Bacteroidetes bacterium]|nr:hypothetical protein [Bacteroidota bacterium]